MRRGVAQLVVYAVTKARLYGESWGAVPAWVLEHVALSDRAVRLYAILARRADETGAAHPSRRQLAGWCHCSMSSIARAKDELVTVGALVVEARMDAAGDPAENAYHVIFARPQCVTGDTRVVSPVERGVVSPVTRKSSYTQELYKSPASQDALAPLPTRRDELFEAVADACGFDWHNLTRPARGALNAAVAAIRDAGGTADQVPDRMLAYVGRFGAERISPNALAKWWPALNGTPVQPVTRSTAAIAAWANG